MVASGAGLGILPAFLARRVPGLQRLLPDQIRVERSFWLSVHEDVAGLTRNRLLADYLGEILHDLP